MDNEIPLSIIIPFKDEKANLPSLISSIEQIKYTPCEFIFVNDHSSDGGEEIINSPNTKFKLINNAGQGKKVALNTGINVAKNEHIITWDADVEVEPNILIQFCHCFNKGCDMVLGPVSFSAKNTFISNYGMLENTSLVAFGLMDALNGNPNMANGANLGFKKQAFLKVGGYKTNIKHAGGDDEFLMHAFVNSGFKIGALRTKEAMVKTKAMPHWKAFINQRMRWGKKTWSYPVRAQLKYVLSQALFFALLVLSVSAFWQGHYNALAIVYGAKVLLDLAWFITLRSFFTLNMDYAYAILSSIFQVAIIPLVFIYVLFGKTTWKGRSI